LYKYIQGGFVGLAKAAGLKAAEVGKVTRKGEVNLKAPFALILEVNYCTLNVSIEYVNYLLTAFQRTGSTDK